MEEKLKIVESLKDSMKLTDIRRNIRELGRFHMAVSFAVKESYVYRARTKPIDWTPLEVSELSNIRDPKEFKKIKRGRANLPRQSVFYGCTLPDYRHEYQRDCILTALEESYQIQSEIIREGFSYVTCWQIKKDFPVVAFLNYVHPRESDYIKQYRLQFVEDCNKKHGDDSYVLEINNRLSSLMAKDYNKNDKYKYKVSSEMIDRIISTGEAGGIVYPSVASKGLALNLAIFDPYVAALELVQISKYRIRKSADYLDSLCLKANIPFKNDDIITNQ